MKYLFILVLLIGCRNNRNKGDDFDNFKIYRNLKIMVYEFTVKGHDYLAFDGCIIHSMSCPCHNKGGINE